MSKIQILIAENDEQSLKEVLDMLQEIGYSNVNFFQDEDSAASHIRKYSPTILLLSSNLDFKAIMASFPSNYAPGLILLMDKQQSTSQLLLSAPLFHDYVQMPTNPAALEIALHMAKIKSSINSDFISPLHQLVKTNGKNGNGSSNGNGATVSDSLYVKQNSKYQRIPYDEIIYIEALKDYVAIKTKENRFMLHSTMKDIERKISPKWFLRIHRSFIINIHKIVTMDYSEVELSGSDKAIPIGGSYREDLQSRLQLI